MKKIQKNEGFTLIELLIVVAIIGIIAAIAVPGLLRARAAGNESSAIGSMRAISSGQVAFASSCGNGAYAPDLQNLGKAPSAAPAGTPGWISPDLDPKAAGAIVKSGYTIDLSGTGNGGTACNAANAVTAYLAIATPVTAGSSGTRSFGTDANNTIYQDPAGSTMTVANLTSFKPIQ